MTAREFLRRYRRAVIRMEWLAEEYREQSRIIDAIKSPLGGDGIHTGNISKTTEEQAVRLAMKAERYKAAQIEAVRIRQEIVRVLNRITEEPRAVLYERYIKGRNWEAVADAVKYSKRQTFRLHQIGLQEVDAIINEWD